LLLATLPFHVLASPIPPATSIVTYDRYSLMIAGERLTVWSGEFHPWRLPSPSMWQDVLEKMKAAGYNAVQIYVHWGYHSPAPGVFDFTGVRDIDLFFKTAKQVGIYVLVRPGPYINAETTSGGFPGWLGTRSAGLLRTTDPTYAVYWKDWLS
ncbi:glycoside hydrolase superfamily, partial [Blyttiomyces helicus]